MTVLFFKVATLLENEGDTVKAEGIESCVCYCYCFIMLVKVIICFVLMCAFFSLFILTIPLFA